ICAPSRPDMHTTEWATAAQLSHNGGAANDGILAVVEPDPGLALAVVVRAPDDQGRRPAAHRDLFGPLRLHAAPDADERVRVPLTADRRLVGVAGEQPPFVRH